MRGLSTRSARWRVLLITARRGRRHPGRLVVVDAERVERCGDDLEVTVEDDRVDVHCRQHLVAGRVGAEQDRVGEEPVLHGVVEHRRELVLLPVARRPGGGVVVGQRDRRAAGAAQGGDREPVAEQLVVRDRQ